jgi:hypothetical protein
MGRPRPWVLVLFLLAYAGLSVVPSWTKVANAKHGRDFATYHYAAAQMLDGGDPYETKDLSKRARADSARKSVHPYFYPPPFLLSMMWSPSFELMTSAQIFFWFNQLFLFVCLATFRLWFRAPWSVLGVLLLSFTPITDNAKMGQANLLVLSAAVAGLWLRSGALVGAAAMAKMSPALYLVAWAARRAWRPVAAAIGVAVGSSVLALPWVDFETQMRFYTEILPGFSSGHYHGLTVRIGLPANHSIPDLFNQAWPGPDKHSLSEISARGSKLCSLILLAVVGWIARTPRDRLGNAALFGAFTVLMLITPVYTYEHHLVMALFPAAVVGSALLDGRLGRLGWVVGVPAYFFTAWPLYWLRPLQKVMPWAHWWLQESKFFGLLMLGVLCAVAAINSPRRE